ncbi:MAG: hypothetical protein ACODAD_00195 [Planctomycetota bacterium]
MELDKTRIVVRERDVFDILDLALQVLRLHFVPLCITMFMGAFPWMIINYLVLRWMLPTEVGLLDSGGPLGGYVRYLWTMMVLVSIQAPMASIFSTVYLGKALFVERPRLWHAVTEVPRMLPRLTWFHVFLRGILPAVCLVIAIDRNTPFSKAEALLLLLFAAVMLRRATSPFLNEIILLERNPVGSRKPGVVTIRRRLVMLHAAASRSTMGLMILVGLYALGLAVGLAIAFHAVQGVLFGEWNWRRVGPLFLWPLAMWSTVAYTTVVRFLSYIDLRIRHEGWEVELRMRAEENRLAESLQ